MFKDSVGVTLCVNNLEYSAFGELIFYTFSPIEMSYLQLFYLICNTGNIKKNLMSTFRWLIIKNILIFSPNAFAIIRLVMGNRLDRGNRCRKW